MSFQFIKFNGIRRYVPFTIAQYESLIRNMPKGSKGRNEWLYKNGVSLEACLIRFRVKIGVTKFDDATVKDQAQS